MLGGLRVGALEPLLISHLERKGDLYKVNVYKGLKGRGKYFTFCTPECAKAIDTYLEFRERCGEKIGPDSPLFRKDFDTELHEDARKNVNPWGYDAIKKAYHVRLLKAGLRTVDHLNKASRKEVKMTHGFRFFFKSQLVLAKVDPDLRELLLGHSPLKDLKLVKSSMRNTLEQFNEKVDGTLDTKIKLLCVYSIKYHLRKYVKFDTTEQKWYSKNYSDDPSLEQKRQKQRTQTKRSKDKEEDEEKTKPKKIAINKYSGNGRLPLHESIIIGETPMFVTLHDNSMIPEYISKLDTAFGITYYPNGTINTVTPLPYIFDSEERIYEISKTGTN